MDKDDYTFYTHTHTHTHTHTQGYYSAMLKKETLPFATTWEDFECTMLTQTQVGQRKANTMISLVWGIYKS